MKISKIVGAILLTPPLFLWWLCVATSFLVVIVLGFPVLLGFALCMKGSTIENLKEMYKEAIPLIMFPLVILRNIVKCGSIM